LGRDDAGQKFMRMSDEAENDPPDAPLAKAIADELVRLMGDGLSREQAFERIKNEIARLYQEEDEAVRRLRAKG
jgi:hypothetical protein